MDYSLWGRSRVGHDLVTKQLQNYCLCFQFTQSAELAECQTWPHGTKVLKRSYIHTAWLGLQGTAFHWPLRLILYCRCGLFLTFIQLIFRKIRQLDSFEEYLLKACCVPGNVVRSDRKPPPSQSLHSNVNTF